MKIYQSKKPYKIYKPNTTIVMGHLSKGDIIFSPERVWTGDRAEYRYRAYMLSKQRKIDFVMGVNISFRVDKFKRIK